MWKFIVSGWRLLSLGERKHPGSRVQVPGSGWTILKFDRNVFEQFSLLFEQGDELAGAARSQRWCFD